MLRINRNQCDGCGQAKMSLCEAICPGTLLIRDESNLITIRDPSLCWDCAACIKRCPQKALSLTLPYAISTSRHSLKAYRDIHGNLQWEILTSGDESVKKIF